MEDFKVPIRPQVSQSSTAPAQNPNEVDKILVPDSPASASNECPYKIPPWSTNPPEHVELKFEILKSGQIIDEVQHLEKKATWTFGRLPQNDIEMAHPTISRFHAVLQYRPKNVPAENATNEKPEPPEGWYIYDLGSTHGTYLNKQRVPPRVFIRMHVGHMLKLGTSTRIFILQGPPEYEEPESELSVTELREQRIANNQLKATLEAKVRSEADEAAARDRGEGVSWGMTEDADEETDLQHNPFAATNNEELFLDDPKRTLRGYFEREGLQLEYNCDEMSPGTFVCRVELPIDDENGRPIVAEVVHKGRKKDCVAQCALESCRILDRHGVLRQANKEPLKRRTKTRESDSDDEFLDRTGDVERKKQRKIKINSNVALSHEDLLKKAAEIAEQLNEVDRKISNYHEKQKQLKEVAKAQENSEDLDAFMENLNEASTEIDKTEIRKLRLEQQNLKLDQEKTERLLKITKPVDMPFVNVTSTNGAASSSKPLQVKKQMPLIGKRNQFSKFKIAKPKIENTKQKLLEESLASDEEEVEDDNEDKESEIKDSERGSFNEPKKVYGPAIIPKEIIEAQTKDDSTANDGNSKNFDEEDKNESMPEEKADLKDTVESEEKTNLSQKAIKKRQRSRHNQRKREEFNTNELEEHETTEKYAKWVPPENQSGDGFTELNKKFGY